VRIELVQERSLAPRRVFSQFITTGAHGVQYLYGISWWTPATSRAWAMVRDKLSPLY
jgi:hypothetical protein